MRLAGVPVEAVEPAIDRLEPAVDAHVERQELTEAEPIGLLRDPETRTQALRRPGLETGRAARYRPRRRVPLAGPVDPLALPALDLGEAAVIRLALEGRVRRMCIDEWKGRRAVAAVGLRVTGSLGLLARAKNAGLEP